MKTESSVEPEATAEERGRSRLDFLQAGKANFKQMLKDASDYKALRRTPYGLLPLLIITAISVFQGFDAIAFTVLAPDIIRESDFQLRTVLNWIGLIGFFLIFANIGVAYFADRGPRVPLVAGGAVLAGIASIFTGRARTEGTLGLGRGGEVVGRAVTLVPRLSLLADWYPPEHRGKAFAVSQSLGTAATLFAPLALGYLAFRTSWRTPFLFIGVPTILLGVVAFLSLKEPIRGYMERKALGASEDVARAAEDPPSLGEAWRIVWAVRTLRRFFIANIFGFAGSFIFDTFFFLFLFDYYGLNVLERAWLGVAAGIFRVIGSFFGGGMVDSLVKRRPQRVLIFYGILGLASAFAALGQASGPPLWVLVGLSIIFGFFGALLGPAGGVIYAQIVPANVRSLGLAVQGFSGIPGILLYAVVVNLFVQNWGLQGAMFAVSPFLFLDAIISFTAAGLFERDMRSAFAANIASEEWRQAQEEGRGKLLVCRDVDVEYNSVQVLFGVDFDVEEGEIIALLGTNGAGKSTLLRAISGTQEASSGAIVFDGRDITHMPPHEIALRSVIHMPGGRGVFPGLTVRENLLLGGWVTEEKETKSRLVEVFRIFPVLKERLNARAGSLSGGEQQMLSLAQAFLSKPRLLMIDELSLGLSPAVVQDLIETVKRIHQTGVTIIVVEQSVNVALTIAERAIFMEKGEVRFVGETSELLRRPDILRAVYVKGTGTLAEAPGTGVKSDRQLRRYELEQSRPILEVKELTKSYGGIQAVGGVSFSLREGEILGLIGPNGAGKTTIFDMISGYQIPDSGRVIFDGTDVTELRADERANRRLVRRFQDARLFPSLTVYENLLVALDKKLDVRNTFLTALQVPQVRQSERRVRRRAEKLIELLELGAFRDKFVKELSTGLRRIVDLACVLAAEPKVLLLDEPSSGIAQAEAEGLAPLLRRVRFDTACSMLVIEHDMPLILAISDELIALDQGQVVVRGLPGDVLEDQRVIESYLGTSEDVVKRSGV